MNCLYQKCFGGSCSFGDDADINTPFCGNALSSVDDLAPVPIGSCGPCQVNPNGGGGGSTCDDMSIDRDDCPINTSCPTNSVCCASGICALEGSGQALGINCP